MYSSENQEIHFQICSSSQKTMDSWILQFCGLVIDKKIVQK